MYKRFQSWHLLSLYFYLLSYDEHKIIRLFNISTIKLQNKNV